MADIVIKRGDTAPSIERTLSVAGDLAGAAVRFKVRDRRGTTVIDRACVIVNAGAKTIRHDWAAADTLTAGYYEAEFEIAYANGTVATDPPGRYLTMEILEDIPSAGAEVDVHEVTLAPASAEIAKGGAQSFVGTPLDIGGNPIPGVPVGYATEDGDIAAIDPVTGLAAGSAENTGQVGIVATAGGKAARSVLTVRSPVMRVEVTPADPSLMVGSSLQMVATAYDALVGGNVIAGLPVVWSLSNALATIDQAGLLTAVQAGEVGVIATIDGVTGETVATIANPATLTLDWDSRASTKRMTADVLANPMAQGPMDIMIHRLQTQCWKGDGMWAITHMLGTDNIHNTGNGATIIATGQPGPHHLEMHTETESTIAEGGDYESLVRRAYDVTGLADAYPRKLWANIYLKAPADYLASVGKTFRVIVSDGPLNRFTLAEAVVTAECTLTADWQRFQTPSFDYASVVNHAALEINVVWPAGLIETNRVQIAVGRFVGGNLPASPLDRESRVSFHDTKGLYVGFMGSNQAKWSDDFNNAAWIKDGVTVTAAVANAPDFADTGSTMSDLAFAAGGTIRQENIDFTDYYDILTTPDDVWAHIYSPNAGPLLAVDLISGTTGTVYSANLVRDVQGFHRARIAVKSANAAEGCLNTWTLRYRIQDGSAATLRAVRAAVEREKFVEPREVGWYGCQVPPLTQGARRISGINEPLIMRAAELMTRQQGTFMFRGEAPWNPWKLLPAAFDKRFYYSGPQASSLRAFDAKFFGAPSGDGCAMSISMFSAEGDYVGDSSYIRLQIPDATMFPEYTQFTIAARWGAVEPRKFDTWWLNGVKRTDGLEHKPASGTGDSVWEFDGSVYVANDCDKTLCFAGWQDKLVTSKEALTDAQIEAKLASWAA